MKRVGIAFGVLLFTSVVAMADDLPTKLPATAKLLTKAEIVNIYDNKPHKWVHPAGDKGNGTTTYVSKTETISGTYNVGGNSGEWEGKITWKNDQYCFSTRGKGKGKFGPVMCNLIYLDGTTAYEVNPKNKAINSINTPM